MTEPLLPELEHRWVDNDGVRLHYVAAGEGPLVLMVHGFPDFWLSWRHLLAPLAETYRVAALDLRGYNLSDQPAGGEHYRMRTLVTDLVAVIRDHGAHRATVMAHDWGGMIAWTLAMHEPAWVERLVICNLPHPRALVRELARGEEQHRASEYARRFQAPDSHKLLTPEALVRWLPADCPRAAYLDAFRRSDLEAMMHYYRENFATEPYREPETPPTKVRCPVLMFHGLEDRALKPRTLNDTWDFIDAPLTLVTVPGAGHWVHHEAHALVTRTTRAWLTDFAGGTGP